MYRVNGGQIVFIKFKTGESPRGFQTVVLPVNSIGTPGILNQYVLDSLSIPVENIPKERELKSGFRLIEYKKTRLLFIVTIDGSNVLKTYIGNLRSALRIHFEDVKGSVWIPLMGTGAGKLSYLASFQVLADELERNKNLHGRGMNVTISLPEDLRPSEWQKILERCYASKILSLGAYSPTDIDLNKAYFNSICNEDQFYFQYALEVVSDLKKYEKPDNVQEKGKLNKDKKNALEELYELWSEENRPKSSELIDLISSKYTHLIQPFEKVNELIAYVDRNAWKGEEYNLYKPRRYVARTSLRQGQFFKYVLEWALNGFKVDKNADEGTIFYNIISYLEDPINNISIVSSTHRQWISKYFLGEEYDPLSFEDNLLKYFNWLNDKVANIKNFTFLISGILYHRDFRFQWDEKMGIVTPLKVDNLEKEGESEIRQISKSNFDPDSFQFEYIESEDKPSDSIDEVKPPPIINNPPQLATLNSDSAHTGQDLLDFEEDVEAFASVMALKELNPPLAIALFGQWGTGKSFFMQKLIEKIDELALHQGFIRETEATDQATDSAGERRPFCEGVCQIQFNAWSYMDTNLWASLVTQIFEGLDEYINQHGSEADRAKERIWKKITRQLDVAKGQRAMLAEKKVKMRHSIQIIRQQVEKADEDLKTKVEEIKKASKQEMLQKAVAKLKLEEKLNPILEDAGLDKETLSQVNPELILKELKSAQSFIHQFLKFSWKDWLWLAVGLALLVLTLIIDKAATTSLIDTLKPIGAGLAFIAGTLSKVRQTAGKLSPLINGVLSIKNEYDEAVQQATSEFEQAILAKRIEADQLEAELQQVTEKLKTKEAEIETLTISSETGLARKAMYSFISEKASGRDYTKHLGIISMIRKDFQTLSHLFVESVDELETLREKLKEKALSPFVKKQTKERIKSLTKYEDFNQSFNQPLERIILYIDDLDRCPEERVVEVLEAVNLLMAFPLFVVVVGVDPRWLKNALIKKYQLQFTGKLHNDEKLLQDLGMEAINPSDYLEKIFQIPFHLKSPEDDSIKKMIGHLLGDAIQEKKKEEREVMPESPIDSNVDLDTWLEEKGGADEHDLVERGMSDAMSPLHDLDGVDMADDIANAVPDGEPPETDETDEEEYEEEMEAALPPGLKKVTPESLKLHWEEGEYMKELSWLIGNTPRTVKRFVNMYRIIRAHEGLSYTNDEDKKDLLCIMFLLALQTGPYQDSDLQIKLMFDSHDLMNLSFEENLIMALEDAPEHAAAQDKFPDSKYMSLMNRVLQSKPLKPLIEMNTHVIYKHSLFIERFRFQSRIIERYPDFRDERLFGSIEED